MATISDVARLAGVGTTTVTKVLAGRPYVSEATRRRIYEAIAALDYQPNSAGRVLRTGVTYILGVITPPPSAHPFARHPFFPRVLDGIGECAAARGYDVLWITAESVREELRSYAALFKRKRVDGLIDLAIHARDPRIDGLRASGHPFVLIGHPEDESLPHVDAANREGGALVGRAFARRGYASAAYIGVATSPSSCDRLAGLQAGLAESGLAVHPDHIALSVGGRTHPDYEELGWETMRRWLAANRIPRAVFTFTDSVAYGVLRACVESGCAVPEELAIVGFDDEPPSRHLRPALASVQQPYRDLGYQAASLLLRILAGDAPTPPRHVLPVHLIERESLGPTPATAPLTAERSA